MSSQTLSHDGGFFNRLEDDVHKILIREKRREQLTEYNGTDNCAAHEHNQACKIENSLKIIVKLKCNFPFLKKLKTVESNYDIMLKF